MNTIHFQLLKYLKKKINPKSFIFQAHVNNQHRTNYVNQSQLYGTCVPIKQGFQYFSSLPVLHHLQVVLFIEI